MFCAVTASTDEPNPQRVEPAWLTDTVLAVARGINAAQAFDRLPVLADALEEAGCDNLPLLQHLRRNSGHDPDCWALQPFQRPTLLLPGGVPLTFAYCPPGAFLMGSEHPEANDDELPVHRVVLTRGFYAGVHPVTREQWQAVMGADGERAFDTGRERRHPVSEVSWVDAQEFCRRAAAHTGRHLRLPTEAEWEYACRAGTTSDYHFGDESPDFSMHAGRRLWLPHVRETAVVGSYLPNAWGLYDCHGNVCEWCLDLYDPDSYQAGEFVDPVCLDGRGHARVVRGGSYDSRPRDCRSARRASHPLGAKRPDVGFRVVFTA